MLNRLKRAAQRVIGPSPHPETWFNLEPAPPGRPRVVVDSFPKSGTHLLGKLVDELGFEDTQLMILDNNYLDFSRKGDWDGWEPVKAANLQGKIRNPLRVRCETRAALAAMKPGQYCTSHIRYCEEHQRFLKNFNYCHIFIIRDLRDCMRSHVEFLLNLKAHLYNPDWYYYLSALNSMEERLLAVIEGKDRFLNSYRYHLEYGCGWLDDPKTLVVRFEDLIGPAGGGEPAVQHREIRRICDYLGIAPSDEQITSVAGRLWGGQTRTMNRGQIGSWSDCFSPRVEERFWEIYGPFMNRLGYGEPAGREDEVTGRDVESRVVL
jgi:hypothetical protein